MKYERVARDAGMDEVDIEAGRDRSEISVERMTKGLWKVDGDYVVEGDCPVCPFATQICGRDLMIGVSKGITWGVWTCG